MKKGGIQGARRCPLTKRAREVYKYTDPVEVAAYHFEVNQ